MTGQRPSHTIYMIAESETFEAIDKMLDPIDHTDAVITPVMPLEPVS
jgi:hypothetical protein